MNKLIAVYGTLRKGGSNHHVLGGSEFISEQRIQGFQMYGCHDYPAIISGHYNEYITVEIYRVKSHSVADAIDVLEGFDRSNPNSLNNYYTLRKINIESIEELLEIYTFDHTPHGIAELGPRILCGDWLKRHENNKHK